MKHLPVQLLVVSRKICLYQFCCCKQNCCQYILSIHRFYKFFCFFKTEVTVLGEIFNTRPVSRVPEPFIAISTIISIKLLQNVTGSV